jgi:hypothetical protein
MRSLSKNILHLEPLYDFVCEHRNSGDDGLRLKNSDCGKKYSHLCKEITSTVDEFAGFYVWGRYDGRCFWHSIYLGKAGFKKDKKNLRKRILEELKDERAFVWLYVCEKEKLLEIRDRIHGGKYTWKRPLLKRGATDIIWAPAPLKVSDSEILNIEADLIEALNPAANLSRTTPGRAVQRHAARIFEKFREIIHKNRPERPSKLHRRVEGMLGTG